MKILYLEKEWVYSMLLQSIEPGSVDKSHKEVDTESFIYLLSVWDYVSVT